MRESFIFYRSFFEAIKNLDDKKRLKMFDLIANFALNSEEIENKYEICEQLFTLIKPQLSANNKRYEDGKKGGRPKKEKTTGFSEKKPNENVNENVIEKEKNKKEKTNGFVIPTLDAISSYFVSLGYHDSSTSFFDYYSSNGWKVGKNPMKDWKAAVRNWNRNSINYARGDTTRYQEYNPNL